MAFGTIPFGSIPAGAIPDGSLPHAGDLLAHTPAEIFAQLVIDRGKVHAYDADDSWPVYIHAMPDGNGVGNTIVAIYNTAGVLHGKDMYGTQYQHHSVQLRLRGFDQKAAYLKVQSVVEDLLRQSNVLVEPDTDGEIYTVHSITQASDIVPILVDDKNRSHIVVNFLLSITRYF